MVTFWATFLIWKFFYFLTYISSFKKGLVAGIFRIEKWFYLDVLDFQIELLRDIFGNFRLGNCFGYFLPKFGQIFSNLLVCYKTCFLRC
jgi:hypothetical protein